MVKLSFTNEQEWHQLRSAHIGGSEIASLFDVQPAYMPGRYALWHYKTGFATSPALNSDLVKWGNRLEKPIAEGIAEDNGWVIRKGGYFQDDTCPHLGASLDYEILSGANDQDGIGCLEIKNVNSFNFSNTWTDGEPPLHILLQLQHQLAATGYKWGVVAALCGGYEPHIFYYNKDNRIITEIRKRITEFWALIDNLKCPPVDDALVNKDVLRELYPEIENDVVDLSNDNETEDLCQQLLDISNRKKAIEKEQDRLKFSLLEKLGKHQRAVSHGYKISMAVSKNTEDRVAVPGEVIKGRSGSRRLIVKEIRV